MKLNRFVRQKIVEPLIILLKQGITPERIALSIAFGSVIGVFPVLGSTTILCAAVALILKLNLPAIQLVNYLVYPLQLILLIPFYKAGEWLFNVQGLKISVTQVLELIDQNVWRAVSFLWETTLRAIVVWLLIAPVAIAGLYFILIPALRRLPSKQPEIGQLSERRHGHDH